jgi:hypothetical protein
MHTILNAKRWLSAFRCRPALWALCLAIACSGYWEIRSCWAGDGDGNGNGNWFGPSVVRVEEDWSLLVNAPDVAQASPQVSTQMARSPYSSRFCNFHLNSCDIPKFQQGGLQLQVWRDTTNKTALSFASAIMNSSSELVTWTQYLRQDGNALKFGISAASSTTWGDFSGQEVDVGGSSNYLSDYTVDYSQSNSGVTFGANRVTSMVLTAVRIYYSDGTMQSDSTPRIIYSTVLDPALGGGQ